MSKPITKIANGQTEISIVTFDGHAPIRSWVKKMTRRHALRLGYTHKIEAGTHYTVEHVVINGDRFVGPVVRELARLDGTQYANGHVPYNYN